MVTVRVIISETGLNFEFKAPNALEGPDQRQVDSGRSDISNAILQPSNNAVLGTTSTEFFAEENPSLSRTQRYITPKIPGTYWAEMVKIQQQTNQKLMCRVNPCQRIPFKISYEVSRPPQNDLVPGTT